MNLLKKLLVFALFFTASANAQLANFNLQVSKTNETCPGNASLTFSVSGTAEGAGILYKIFLLPDTTNPIAIQTQNSIGSLTAGSYSVMAIQSLGTNSNSQQKTVTILNESVPLNFTVTATDENCSAGGTLTVNVTSGTGVQYQVIEGPVRRPLQTSNVFYNMPEGLYNVRVFDECGTGKVITHAVVFKRSVLSLSDAIYPDTSSPDCATINVNHEITPSTGVITYPLTVELEYDAMDMFGNPVTYNQTYNNGPEDILIISSSVPRGENDYGYSLKVIDNCSALYEKNGSIDPGLSVNLSLSEAECSQKYLTIETSKFAAPYTISFLSFPEGFNPLLFNESTNGVFTTSVVEYGSEAQTVPFGQYVIQVTDACERTVTKELLVELVQPTPIVLAHNKGCFSEYGTIKINIPDNKLVSAVIISSPSSYTMPLPQNLSHKIDDTGMFVARDLPLGTYILKVVDDCGFEYEITVEVPPFVEQNFPVKVLPSCDEGFGSMTAKSRNSNLVSIYVISAPGSFGQSLPYDVSNNITQEGEFYMNHLPEGEYVFKATDECGIEKNLNVNILGYQSEDSGYELTRYCGSFVVMVADQSNLGDGLTYWLQKYNPVTNTWGHPVTGQVYTEGSLGTPSTGIHLINYSRRFNFNLFGKFRIIKNFKGYGSGTSLNTICYEIIGEFEYAREFEINNAYTLACIGQPNDVYLEVTGHPTSYSIIEKNNQPFTLHNGTDNIFRNLEAGEYTFLIKDACDNVVIKKFNLIDLPSLADATQPADMVICTAAGTSATQQFHLASQNQGVLGPLHSTMYTVTYHLTQEDADNNTNPLPEYYTNTSNGQTIYVRLVHNEIELCHGTTSFRLFVGQEEQVSIITTGTLCEGESLSLTAAVGFSGYRWSTGETTRTIYVTEPGIYTLLVEKTYGNASCDAYAEVEIIESSAPEIIKVEALDWTYDQNQIIVHTEGIGAYLYSLDGITYQESNTFTGLENGVYTVFVKDANGCGSASEEVVLLNYPKFFTPNGDGYHDTWRIKYSTEEPNMKIVIFDRFGKIITNFGANHSGWDGTFNGKNLPATDYWFVVTREDGRELKGHFAMLR